MIRTFTEEQLYKLPYNPAGLLLLALRDLEAVERDPQVAVDMSSWVLKHSAYKGALAVVEGGEVKTEAVCSVCMAGAVLRAELPTVFSELEERIQWSPDRMRQLGYISGTEAAALEAINDFRIGLLGQGLARLANPAARSRRATGQIGGVPQATGVLRQLGDAWVSQSLRYGLQLQQHPLTSGESGPELNIVEYREADAAGERSKNDLRHVCSAWFETPIELRSAAMELIRRKWLQADYPYLAELPE